MKTYIEDNFLSTFFFSSFIFLTFLHILHNYPADRPDITLVLSYYRQTRQTERWKNNTNIMNNGKYQDCPSLVPAIREQWLSVFPCNIMRYSLWWAANINFQLDLAQLIGRGGSLSLSLSVPVLHYKNIFIKYGVWCYITLHWSGWFIQNIRMKSDLRYVGVFMLQYCTDTAPNLNHSDW